MNHPLQDTGLSRSRVVRILKKIPTFDGLRDDEYESLLNLFSVRRYSAGQTIFREGDSGYTFYVVLSGRIEVASANAGVLTVMEPCQFLGEIAVVSGQPRTATARVVKDAAMLEITRERLDSLVGKAPRVTYVIMRNIAEAIADRLIAANRRLGSVSLDH